MSGDEIREERIGETVRELADAYMRVKEHVLALATWRDARAADVAGGGMPKTTRTATPAGTRKV